MNLDVWDGIFIGIYIGVFIGWWWNRKPPVIKDAKIEASLVIDSKVLSQLNGQMVGAWLDQNGLTWMPKGAVFDPNKVVKK